MHLVVYHITSLSLSDELLEEDEDEDEEDEDEEDEEEEEDEDEEEEEEEDDDELESCSETEVDGVSMNWFDHGCSAMDQHV